MRALFYTVVARIRAFLRPAASDADFDQELELHLAMAEEDKVRRGMSPEQARREARLELGGAAQLREAARAARGLPWLETFWLDAKLGLRMLRRSWGLTLVGGLAMAVTIGLGASMFTIWDTFAATRLPLDEGDRVVAIQPFDKAAQRVHRATPLPDFRRWRETLKSVEHVSAMRPIDPAVIARNGAIGSVPAAEMTASGFQLARVEPLLGRPLIEEDEREGAEPVAVIGYKLWQSGFSSDPAVLGQRIQIADTPHVVVGVMPDGFRFPMNQRLWTPLRTNPVVEVHPGSGDVFIFARLVPGATREGAHAEATTVGLLPHDAAAGTIARREPRVVQYAVGMFPDVHSNSWLAGVIFLVGALLLIPPCANIAILVYARTVTRQDEFAARTALGASRGRIVMQLFVEVLVLASGAGIAGFLLAREFSDRLATIVMPTMDLGNLPFWMELEPSLATVLFVAGLSLLAAAIAGAVPALRVTGRWRRSGVFALGPRGTGARLGKTWTVLLATQVALSLAILPSGMEMMWGIFRPTIVAMIVGPGLPVEEFLTASLVMEGDKSRFDNLRIEAVRRLTSEAGISGVTVSAARLLVEPSADIEVEGSEGQDVETQFNSVDDKFFEVFGVRFVAGRRFDASDFGPGRTPVIVNQSFVTEVLGDPPSPRLRRTGTNALGRRIRYRDRESPAQRETALVRRSAQREGGWHEIVGVVEDFPVSNNDPTMFHPMTRAPHPVSLTIRAPSGIGLAADRLREVTSGLDRQLRVGRLRSLEEMFWERRSFDDTFGFMVGAVTVIVLLFSMAGIYTLMAFIVAQRWREIGVRTALGAQPRQLLIGIFGRAAVPLLIGAMAGCAIALRLHSFLPIAEAGGRSIPGIVPASAALMIVVGLLAVAGPARRAIRIDPTEALRVS
jgi:predicted permease